VTDTPAIIHSLLSDADILYTEQEILTAINKLAEDINKNNTADSLVVIAIMTGAIVFAADLVKLLKVPLAIDYVDASRYGDNTTGGELTWRTEPTISLAGREVLLLDDIFDEGLTLSAIRQYCLEKGASKITTAVLVDKQRDKQTSLRPDYVGLMIEDRYVVGYGMDYKGYLRNLPAIYALNIKD